MSVVPSLVCVTMELVRTLMDVTGVTATQASGWPPIRTVKVRPGSTKGEGGGRDQTSVEIRLCCWPWSGQITLSNRSTLVLIFYADQSKGDSMKTSWKLTCMSKIISLKFDLFYRHQWMSDRGGSLSEWSLCQHGRELYMSVSEWLHDLQGRTLMSRSVFCMHCT